MSDDYDIEVWGVWDPEGNAHDWRTCLCPNCDSEEARNNQREAEERADREAEKAKRIAMANKVRAHREQFDALRLAEEDRWQAISYRLAGGREVSAEDKAWHDRVLAERRERYQRTRGES